MLDSETTRSRLLLPIASLVLSSCAVAVQSSAPHAIGGESCYSALDPTYGVLSIDGVAARTMFLENTLVQLGDAELTSPDMSIVGTIVDNADKEQLRQCRLLNEYEVIATRIVDDVDRVMLEEQVLTVQAERSESIEVLKCFILASTNNESAILRCIAETPPTYKIDDSVDVVAVS